MFLELIPVDRAEISHMKHTTEFVPVTEPARLPGSDEEALNDELDEHNEKIFWQRKL